MADQKHLDILKQGVEVWNQWREKDPAETPDLTQADLGGAYLRGADLREADLREAYLHEADLREANLGGADLREAYLGGADLREAYLHEAILTNSNLSGANLAGAYCTSTFFAQVDLSSIAGLEEVEHEAPSTLGLDTLSQSRGAIPEKFLRGCGLADWEVEAAKLYKHDLDPHEIIDIQQRVFELRTESPIQISPLFISYSWADAEFVDHLGNSLDENHIRYWRDKKDATAGRLDKVIDRGIRLNPTLLLVLSENSVNAPWVEYEVGKAVDLSRELKRDVLCPIALDDSWATSERMSGELRRQIKKHVVLLFEDWKDDDVFEKEKRKLLDGLKLHYQK